MVTINKYMNIAPCCHIPYEALHTPLHTPFSGVGNAAAAAALAAAPFRPRLCGKASSEPYNSSAVGKGSTTPVIE